MAWALGMKESPENQKSRTVAKGGDTSIILPSPIYVPTQPQKEAYIRFVLPLRSLHFSLFGKARNYTLEPQRHGTPKT